MTSLQHSVFGGLRNGRNPVPAEATTMAEHLRRAGYLTALLTTNANAGRMSGLERGFDLFRDSGGEQSTSSSHLHADFWRWRRQYPAEPFLVHFQTTDVHEPHSPVAPFAGLFVTPERRRRFEGWLERAEEISGVGITDAERPDLVQEYTRLLQEQWKAHQALAARFTRGEETPMSPEQLEALRALGYIQ